VVSIRSAVEDDLPELVAMGQRFLAYHPMSPRGDDVELAAALRLALLEGFLWVAVADEDRVLVGVLVAVHRRFWFTPPNSPALAVELAWWVEPSHRQGGAGIKLLRQFEQWAAETGSIGIVLSDIVGDDGESRIGDLVARAGYQLIERSHFKWLDR